MKLERLEVELDGPVARVWLNRPEVRNAFDGLMVTELRKTLFDLRHDRRGARDRAGRPRAVLLRRAPTSQWMKAMAALHARGEPARGPGPGRPLLHRLRVARSRWWRASTAPPSGGGAGLVAACDIPVAALGTQFGFTRGAARHPARRDLALRASRKIGESAARELFLTGERFEAVRAQRDRPRARRGPRGRPRRRGRGARPGAAARPGPRAVAEAKALIREVAFRRVEDVQRYTVERIADIRVSPEGQEGMRAFLEKRKPGWAA